MHKLLEIYKGILNFAGFEADEEGLISVKIGEKKQPALINDSRLALPTSANLRNNDKKDLIIFHPLLENTLRGESEVIQKLKHAINVKLNYSIAVIFQSLLNLIASPSLHNKLETDELELMTNVKDVDEKTVTNFVNYMLMCHKTKPDRAFVNIFLRRGGVVKDRKYSRAGIVTFPFYNELVNNKIDKFRVKDVTALKQLHEYIFSKIDESDYDYGSTSITAPYLDALLFTAANIAARLNDIVQIHGKHIDESSTIEFDASWMDDMKNIDDLTDMIKQVPMQRGNDGAIEEKTQPTTSVQFQAPPTFTQPQPQMVPQQPRVEKTNRGISFSSVMNTLHGGNNGMMPMQQPMGYGMAPQQVSQDAYYNNRVPSWGAPAMGNPMMNNGMMNNQIVPTGPAMFNNQDGQYYYPMSNGQYMHINMVRQMYPNMGY